MGFKAGEHNKIFWKDIQQAVFKNKQGKFEYHTEKNPVLTLLDRLEPQVLVQNSLKNTGR